VLTLTLSVLSCYYTVHYCYCCCIHYYCRLSQALGAVFRSPLGSPFRFPPLKNGGAWQSLPEEGASLFESEHFDPESSSANGFSNGFFDLNGKSSKAAVLSGKTGSKGSSVKGSGSSAVAGAAAFSNISARECALVSAYEGFGREPGWSFRSSNRSNSGSSRGSASSSSRNVLMSNTMANASTSSVRASVLMHGRASLSRQVTCNCYIRVYICTYIYAYIFSLLLL
jgi:hypothetical protein